MSTLRGLLRTQRLGRHDNKLAKMSDLVQGHELDWLSFEIAQMKPLWHITEQAQTQGNSSTNTSKSHKPPSLTHKEDLSDGSATLAVATALSLPLRLLRPWTAQSTAKSCFKSESDYPI